MTKSVFLLKHLFLQHPCNLQNSIFVNVTCEYFDK